MFVGYLRDTYLLIYTTFFLSYQGENSSCYCMKMLLANSASPGKLFTLFGWDLQVVGIGRSQTILNTTSGFFL